MRYTPLRRLLSFVKQSEFIAHTHTEISVHSELVLFLNLLHVQMRSRIFSFVRAELGVFVFYK